MGTWQQSGSTGEWPRVVNLWEMAGFDGWAEILEYQYAGGRQPGPLRSWWAKALEYRSGGVDRILEPAPWSPTRAELIERGTRGLATVQEVTTVRAGMVEHYLEAVASHWLPFAAARGLTLVGAWRTAMRDTEAVLFWSLPTLRDFTRHLRDLRTAPESRAWLDVARTWRTDYRETLLVPSVWCVTHPAWKEPARRQPRRTHRR